MFLRRSSSIAFCNLATSASVAVPIKVFKNDPIIGMQLRVCRVRVPSGLRAGTSPSIVNRLPTSVLDIVISMSSGHPQKV